MKDKPILSDSEREIREQRKVALSKLLGIDRQNSEIMELLAKEPNNDARHNTNGK